MYIGPEKRNWLREHCTHDAAIVELTVSFLVFFNDYTEALQFYLTFS
jgi:hypothetical protein